jgi:hypothetical protein
VNPTLIPTPILQPYEGKEGQNDGAETGDDAKGNAYTYDEPIHLDLSTLSVMALWFLMKRVLPEWDVNSSFEGRQVRTRRWS